MALTLHLTYPTFTDTATSLAKIKPIINYLLDVYRTLFIVHLEYITPSLDWFEISH